MSSIIGKTNLIKHFRYARHKKPKPQYAKGYNMKQYHARDERLRFLGFAFYGDYLKSDEWAEIRARKLARHPECMLCNKPAEVVHHLDYEMGTLLGLQNSSLVCLCHACHELIEVDSKGRKRSLKLANTELYRLAEELGREKWIQDRDSSRIADTRRQHGPEKAAKLRKRLRRQRKRRLEKLEAPELPITPLMHIHK